MKKWKYSGKKQGKERLLLLESEKTGLMQDQEGETNKKEPRIDEIRGYQEQKKEITQLGLRIQYA